MQSSNTDLRCIDTKIKEVFQREIYERIREILTSKLVFFVGAGISNDPPSNLPLFKRLNKELIRLTTGGLLNEKDYKSLSTKIRPEVALQILREVLPQQLMYDLLIFIKEIMAKAEPNHFHFFLAQAIKQGNWVFTTNYDNLIEKACEKMGLNIEKEGRRCYNQQHFISFIQKYIRRGKVASGYLFKLHGSIEDIKSILDTLREVERGLSDFKKEVLKYFWQNFNFVFMGYSCRDDFDIFPELLNTPSEKGICWFSYTEESLDTIVFSKKRIEQQKSVEEDKPLGELKNWEIININDLLLKRKNPIKIICNISEFVQKISNISSKEGVIKKDIFENREIKEHFTSLAKNISEYHKHLIAGRLFLFLEVFDKAEEYFKKAENITDREKEKVVAQKLLSDTYYRIEKPKAYWKAIEVLTQKTLPFYSKIGDVVGIVQITTDIANNLRRLREVSEASKYAEKAKNLLEQNKEEFKEKGYYNLEYGRCLNVLGLIHYGRGDSTKSFQELLKGLEFCKRSHKVRELTGDKSLIADSENAIGLILRVMAWHLRQHDKEKAIQLIRNEKEIAINGLTLKSGSLNYLKDALDKKERVGDYRGCCYCLRNLALAHDLLGELIPEESEKHFLQAAKYLEKELDYIERMPNPPLDRYLDRQFWLGMEYRKAENYITAIEVLKKVVRERERDWHNKARALNELRECYENTNDRERCIKTCKEIKTIYESVLADIKKMEEIKKKEIKLRNAIEEILPKTANSFRKFGLETEAKQIADIISKLKREATAKSV